MNDDTQNPDMSADSPPDRKTGAFDIRHAWAKWNSSGDLKHIPTSAYETYLFGKAGSEDREAWNDTAKGRAAIRFFSRGVAGAAFFTIGGRYARMEMEGYDGIGWNWSKPLQVVAKGIDVTFGKGFTKAYELASRIGGTEATVARDAAKRAMLFRQSRTADLSTVLNLSNGPVSETGRSYGAEVVSFTFDFAAASVGDATARTLIKACDPNVKKSWWVNDQGKPASHDEHKHFVLSKWAEATASNLWTIFSNNQGEDWAAAIPYAFQMKFQSKLLNSAFMGKGSDGRNRFAGHDIVFDSNWNGGAYRRGFVKNPTTGVEELKIIGDYQLAGAIDLHLRFVGYNWYTLMFREGYNAIGNAFTHWKEDGFAIHAPHLPQHFNPITATLDGVAESGRYLAKSFIKANMYMNPAVVPFWFLRTSQSKWRGEKFIEPNAQGVLARGAVNEIYNPPLSEAQIAEHYYGSANYDHYLNKTLGEKFEKGFSKTLNVVGRGQFWVGNQAGNAANFLAEKNLLPKSKWFSELVRYKVNESVDGKLSPAAAEQVIMKRARKNFMNEYTDAALSYTPYMYAKQEFGLRVDDSKGDGKPGQMDKAIYRFMDNVASFNMPASWKSMKEMWTLGIHLEGDEPTHDGSKVTVPDPQAISTRTFTSKEPLPTTTVTAGDVTHEPANLSRRAGDEDKTWAQSVVGSNVNPAHIMNASATRH